MILRWIMREIRNNLRFSILFIINLGIGLTGFLCVNSFRDSISNSLEKNAKEILSADIGISSRKRISEVDLKSVRSELMSFSDETHTWEFFSMTANLAGESRIVQLKAIENGFPFYGEIQLESGKKITTQSDKEITHEDKAWVYPEVLSQLHVKLGDSLKIGDKTFVISDIVQKDISSAFRLSSIAPKIYIGLTQIEKSNLVSFGATMTESYLYRFKSPHEIEQIKKNLEAVLPDPAVQILTPSTASEDSSRATKYLSDYLGLISLMALFLTSLGSFYIFRYHLNHKVREIAILNTLGLQRKKAVQIYITQILALSCIAIAVSLVLSFLLLPLLNHLINEFIPSDLEPHIGLKSFVVTLIIASLQSLLVCLPFLKQIYFLKISELFSEDIKFNLKIKIKDLLLFTPAIALFTLVSIWQSQSFKIGGIFVGMIMGSIAAISFLSFIVIYILNLATPRIKNWKLKQALNFINRKKVESLIIINCLSLSSILVALLPQLKGSIEEDLKSPENIKLPALFLFDIQEAQIDPLKDFLQKQSLSLTDVSPLVRARILKVNDESYERAETTGTETREEELDKRFRNRGANISYREHLYSTETVVDGRGFTETYNPDSNMPPEISIEEQYAGRMHIKLNDIFTFDVQGIEIKARVSSIRKVKWNAFQPNFFIVMQKGVLDDAPKTFLASIPATKDLDSVNLQNKLVHEFSNVSIVDVQKAVQSILELIGKMMGSIQLMAYLCFFCALIVLISIVINQMDARVWDINLLKILGAKNSDLYQVVFFESLTLALVSSSFGLILSLVFDYVVSVYIFETNFIISLTWPLLSLLGLLIITTLTNFFIYSNKLRQNSVTSL